MFEDLKKLISEQFSNLSKLVESLANAKSDQLCATDYTRTTSGSVRVRGIMRLIQKSLSKRVSKSTKSNWMNPGWKLEKQQNKPLPVQKHLHTIELKSSKVVIALISLGVALFSSVCQEASSINSQQTAV